MFLFSESLAQKCGEGPFFDQETAILDYGRLFELLLKETAKAFKTIDNEKRLPKDMSIGIHNDDFKPCDDCKSAGKAQGAYNPSTHCTNCIPVVTHTRQGVCVLTKRKGKTLIMDLIPLLPCPERKVMWMFSMVTTSLLKEKPLGWNKSLMNYFSKDRVVPEAMHELSQELEPDFNLALAVKLLNYGPSQNYQIRPGQAAKSLSSITGDEANRCAYQYAKTLLKLLQIENVGSYTVKKIILSCSQDLRGNSTSMDTETQARHILGNILENPEVKHSFAKKVISLMSSFTLDFTMKEFSFSMVITSLLIEKTLRWNKSKWFQRVCVNCHKNLNWISFSA